MLAFCLDPDAPAEHAIDDALRDTQSVDELGSVLDALSYRCPRTAERARRMLRRLHAEGFASFS